MPNTATNAFRFALAAMLAASLAACGGGGGGGGSDTPTPTPEPVQLVADEGNLVTTVPAATYAAGYARDAFDTINALRSAAGAGLIAQSAVVDAAAEAHGNYININGFTPSFHTESSSLVGFTGVTVADRIAAAGLSGGTSSEVLMGGVAMGTAEAVEALMGTVYHGISLLAPATRIGIGNAVDGASQPLLVIDTHARPTATPAQVAPAGAVIAYPYSGAIVSGTFDIDAEFPRPAPGLVAGPTAGAPVNASFRNADWVNAIDQGNFTAVVTQVSLEQVGVGSVAGVTLAAPGFTAGAGVTLNADSLLPEGFISFIPAAPLADGTYRVRLSATIAGKVASVDHTFQVVN